MIHFNELNVTDDGKRLAVDVEVDNLSIYDGCYIESISVNTAENHCAGKTSSALTLYQGNKDILYVDMNGDGVVDEADIAIIDWLNEKIGLNTTEAKYDVNGDGVVDLRDISAIINAILSANTIGEAYEKYPNCDVDSDEQVSITDVNALIGFVLSKESQYKTKLCADEYDKIFGYDIDDEHSVDGLYSIYTKKANAYKGNSKDGFFGHPESHVAKCWDKTDLIPLIGSDEVGSHLFIVTVTANINGKSACEVASLGCGWDNGVLTGLAYNGYPLYRKFMDMANTVADDCDTSNTDAMVDYILNYHAFEFAARTGDWCKALEYWENLMGSGIVSSASKTGYKGCGCHGRY